MTDRLTETTYGDATPVFRQEPRPAGHARLERRCEKAMKLLAHSVHQSLAGTTFTFWRDFRNLPLFMENIRAVSVADDRRSHWIVVAPADRTVEWDSIITEDVPDEVIAWTSEEGASVRNSGRIEFSDSTNGRGTIVRATIVYDPPGVP